MANPVAVDDIIGNLKVNDRVLIQDISAQPTPVSALLLSNDTDADGDKLTVSRIFDVVNGTLTEVNFDMTKLYFIPNAGYLGAASFKYTVQDSYGNESNAATVQFNIVAAGQENQAPSAVNDKIAVSAVNTKVVIPFATLLANDTDPNNDTLTISSVSNVEINTGSVAIVGENVEFTPRQGYIGAASFAYTIADGKGLESTAVANLSIGVTHNDAPVAVDDIYGDIAMNKQFIIGADSFDTDFTKFIKSNDTDANGDVLRVINAFGAVNGTISNASGAFIFHPDQDYMGSASFQYTLSDGRGGESTATVRFNVVPEGQENKGPILVNDTIGASALDAKVIIPFATLLANDADSNNDTLTISSVSPDTHGMVAIVGNTVEYTPNAGYKGPALFVYTVADGKGLESTAVVNLSIGVPDNRAPLAVDDVYSDIAVNEQISIESDLSSNGFTKFVKSNDTDADGDSLTVTKIFGAVHGTVFDEGFDGLTRFVPDQDYTGPVSFQYTVIDGRGGESTATVRFNVVPEGLGNKAPLAQDDNIESSAVDTKLVISLATLLANDTDQNNDTLSIVEVFDNINGTVVIVGDTVEFTPTQGYTGPASFDYSMTDGKGFYVSATVNLSIGIASNIAPVAVDDVIQDVRVDPNLIGFSIDFNDPRLLSNDKDPDGDPLTITNIFNGVGGTAGQLGSGLGFQPTPGYIGPASFEYTISDGKGGEATATAHFNLLPPKALTASSDVVVVTTNSADGSFLLQPQAAATYNDISTDGSPLVILSAQNVIGGNIEYRDDGNHYFVPAPNYSGPAGFDYTVSDGKGNTETAHVYLTINRAADIFGTTGNDILLGSDGNNVIEGSLGDDIIVGGAGSDTLTGGLGADIFSWSLADTNSKDTPVDIITDGQVGDALYLADLLQGETSTIESLDNYLHFNFEDGNTTISISANGNFADNGHTGTTLNPAETAIDQKIVLAGIDITGGNTYSDQLSIQLLLDHKALITNTL